MANDREFETDVQLIPVGRARDPGESLNEIELIAQQMTARRRVTSAFKHELDLILEEASTEEITALVALFRERREAGQRRELVTRLLQATSSEG